MKQNILVTGAGGFVGGNVAKRLFLKETSNIRVVDIKWDGFIGGFTPQNHVEKITTDLRVLENCINVTYNMDYVFHFAADMGGIGYISDVGADIMYNSVLINTNMIKACAINKVKKIFWPSSACVYPNDKMLNTDSAPLKETDAFPSNPDNYYGWEKLFTEKLYEAFNKDYGVDIRIARFHTIYGPNCIYSGGKEKAPAALCRKVIECEDGGSINIWGDGEQTRSFCYINDCIDGIMLLMESDYNKPVNVGSTHLISINDLADLIINISGKNIKKKYDLSKPQGARGRNSDNTLIEKLTGWHTKISIEDGIKETYRWIESDYNKNSI